MQRFQRTILGLALTATLVAAAPRETHFSGLWSFLVSLWGEAGCQADPSGHCQP
jgi:hypothetical protein